MDAIVITIGDEILIGQIVNTNAAWIGEALTRSGIEISRMVTVPDRLDAIECELRRSCSESRIVITTGGLGPTHDDITKDAIVSVFEAPLELDEEILNAVRSRFEQRGHTMPEVNHSQAMVPKGFEAVMNTAGTAPALLKCDKESGRVSFLAVLPGVPHEMKIFMESVVLPKIVSLGGAMKIRQKTLLTVGIGESRLQQELKGVDELLGASVSLAYLPSLNSLRLRLSSVAKNEERAESELKRLESWIRARAADWIYGQDDQTLEGVVAELLVERDLRLAIAESCTGGWVANRITNVAGSSSFFQGGVVAYSNEAKVGALGVANETLLEHGAVSRQTACEMASGVRKRFHADVGISTTGILGPGGGTEDRPVGTIWIGLSRASRTSALRIRLGTDRVRNKERASTIALNLIRTALLKGDDGDEGD